MSKFSKQIREAALGPRPIQGSNSHVWMGMEYGEGSCPAGLLCDKFMDDWDEAPRLVDEHTQRPLLLLVAEALQ
jgi:hypothetical protein